PPNRANEFPGTRNSRSHSRMLRDPVGSPHGAYLRSPASDHLTPFAKWAALPPADDDEVSVAKGPRAALIASATSRFLTMPRIAMPLPGWLRLLTALDSGRQAAVPCGLSASGEPVAPATLSEW